MTFSVTDAAFEGFRLMRDRPFALVGWAIFSVVAGIVLAGLMILTIGPALLAYFAQVSTSANTGESPPIGSMMSWFWSFAGVIVVGSILYNAVQTAAVYRSVLRPAERSWAYLRLGADEFRLIVLSLAYLVVGIIGFGGGVLLLALAAGAAGDAGGVLIGVVGGLALFCLWVFLAIRLSLAAAVTFAERRVSLFGSWRVTRGVFWPLFGMFLLVAVMSIGVSLVGSVLAQFFLGMGLQPLIQSWSAAGSPDLSAFSQAGPLAVISTIGYLIVTLAMGVVQVAITYAPQAAAYRGLTAPPPETTGEVFS